MNEIDWQEGETPLHVAVKIGDRVVINALLQNGANGEIKDNSGKTPLALAEELVIYMLLINLEDHHLICLAKKIQAILLRLTRWRMIRKPRLKIRIEKRINIFSD